MNISSTHCTVYRRSIIVILGLAAANGTRILINVGSISVRPR